jgi:5-hydroxyisourate hydrolase
MYQKGSPAKGVTIQLEKFNEQTKNWVLVDKKITDSNGRITNFLPTKILT